MKRPGKSFFIFLIIIAAIIAMALFYRQQLATKYNTANVNGNTGGNLYNNGLFCEHNGSIYFANPNDGFRLYSMTASGTDLTVLSEYAVSSINVDDNYVYYIRDNSSVPYNFSFLHYNDNVLCRTDLDGKHEMVLEDAPCMYATLYGNDIFYLHYDTSTATTLYRVSINGGDNEQVSEEPIIPCSGVDQYMYYTGVNTEHYIHRMDTTTLQNTIIDAGNCWMPQVAGSYVYYMDCDNNYALTRRSLADPTATPEQLTSDRVDSFNVYGSYIFYQRSSTTSPALIRMQNDGSASEIIAEGNYENINVTSSYVYFTEFGTEDVILRTPTSGAVSVTPFSP